jgi:hypothetical protein
MVPASGQVDKWARFLAMGSRMVDVNIALGAFLNTAQPLQVALSITTYYLGL